MADFEGFPKQTLTFLRGISKNNSKAWFDEHRDDYDNYLIAPAKTFVSAVGDELRKLAPGVQAEPRVNGSIFRINRDTRFSKDKTPYKDHLDLWFWEGARKEAVSGFFWRLTATQLLTGVGAHCFEKEKLAQYRQALVGKETSAELLKVAAGVEKAGYELEGTHYKRSPKGFEVENERLQQLLLHDGLHTGKAESHPAALHSAQIVAHCIDNWKKVAPLHRWLVDTL